MSAETTATNEVAATTAPAQDAAAAPEETGLKIFVGNLAYATNDEGLKAHFAPVVGDIISANVILRGTRSAGYGFVTVAEPAQVEKAVAELSKKELDGRSLIVEAAKPAEDKEKEKSEKRSKKRAGRRGNKAVTGEVTEAEAEGDAAAAEGADADKPKKKRTKSRKSKAKKSGEEGATAEGETAAAADGTEAAKKPKRTRAPKVPRAENGEPIGEPSKSVLFVANLAFNVDDAALSEIFTAEGIKVVSARVVRRRFGQPRRSKGYGFVDVGDEEQQKKAIAAFQGKEVNGRELAVKVAISTPPGEDDEDAEEKAADAGVAEVTAATAAVSI